MKKTTELEDLLWGILGISVAFATSYLLIYYLRELSQSKDPRVKQVKELIEEAERLINLGKSGN
ncbi:MAG: hypothetical protein HYU63_04245 [Armatimonadetes bacterium]|nr:hypothetical protein [Armatimonadota bacterium]